MKKILSNYRYYVLVVLATVFILGVMAVPNESLPTANYIYTLISSKVIGFLAAYVLAKLYERWKRLGTIPELMNAANNY